MKQLFFAIFICFLATSVYAQHVIKMSQYMYNKYIINPAFGGSHESLSLYGSYGKQWVGIENSPQGASFSMHSPLKNERMALGVQFFNENMGVSRNTGFNASYTYRLLLNNESKFTFGVSIGMVNYKANWDDVVLIDEQDEVFNGVEQSSAPWIGFGVGLYHDNYFAGFSIPSLMYHNWYEDGENSLDLGRVDYLITGGYLVDISESLTLQPSVLLRINADQRTYIDVGMTAIVMKSLLLGASYRSDSEIIGIVGYQLTSQFRFTYSVDYYIDTIGSYNNGTHEIALQFDFGFKINSPNPKYF